MSSPLPPLHIPPLTYTRRLDNAMISLPPISTISSHQRSFSGYTSSPPRSSSPPMTPYSTRSSFSQAHIRSSPEMDYDYPARHYASHYDEPMSKLDRYSAHTFTKLPNTNVALPSLKSIMAEDLPFDTLPRVKTPPSVVHHDLVMERAYSSSSVPDSADGSMLSDDESSHVQDEDEGFSFEEKDIRATFFQMSEERGRWQFEPIPFKPDLRTARYRHSAPTEPAPKAALLPSRPASEPAPSTARCLTPVGSLGSHAQDDFAPVPEPSSPLMPVLPHSDGCDSVPSLMSDAESVDREESHCPPSPLPPSSPPMSLYSLPSSPIMRSSSPLSLPPSSPVMVPIDSLPEAEDEHHQEDDLPRSSPPPAFGLSSDATAEIPDIKTESNFTRETLSDPAPYAPSQSSATFSPELAAASTSSATTQYSAIHSSSSASFQNSIFDDDVAMSPLTRGSTPLDDEPTDMQLDGGHLDLPRVDAVIDSLSKMERGSSQSADPTHVITSRHTSPNATASSSKPDQPLVEPQAVTAKSTKAKGKAKEKRKQEDEHEDGPVKKKAKAKMASDEVKEKVKKPSKKVERALTPDDDEDEEEEAPKPKKRKNNKDSDSKAKGRGKNKRAPPSPKKERLPPIPSPDDAMDAEICGMLIEGLATSRASSIPASKLLKSVMEAKPSLKEQKSEPEWMEVVNRVLSNGESTRGTGVFGKIDSSFKDDSDRSLEAQWFYNPDLDPDQDRATLVKSMMPRAGKRAATMKYKQYYYAPLGKISRWDPEDEI